MTDCEKQRNPAYQSDLFPLASIVLLWPFHPGTIFRVMERCTITRLFNNWLIPCNTQCGKCDGNVNESVSLLKGGFSIGIMQWHHYITRAEKDSGKRSNVPRSPEKAAQTDVQWLEKLWKRIKRVTASGRWTSLTNCQVFDDEYQNVKRIFSKMIFRLLFFIQHNESTLPTILEWYFTDPSAELHTNHEEMEYLQC